MARHRKVEEQNKVVETRVKLDNVRPLVTVGPDHEFWECKFRGIAVYDALVRVQPPSDISDADLERAKLDLIKAGAAVVRVLPRATKQAVLTSAEALPKPHRTARQVVSELLLEAQSADPAALKTIIEETMAKVGL